MSENTRNDKETNNVKLTNSVQDLATANDIRDTVDDVSNTIFHQPANEKDTVYTIAGQSVQKTKRKTTGLYSEKNTWTKVRKKGQTKCYREIIPGFN